MAALAALAAVTLTTTVQAGEDVHVSWIRAIENAWILREVRGKETGAFSFCVIETTYEATDDGGRRRLRGRAARMSILYSGDDRMGVSITSEDWKTSESRAYDMRFLFRDGSSYDIKADGLASGGLMAMFRPNPAWLKRMMLDAAVEIIINGKTLGQMRLNKSALAIKALTKCGLDGRSEGGASADTFGARETAPASDTF